MANNTTVDIIGKNDKLKRSLDDSENLVQGFGKTIRNVFIGLAGYMAARQVINWGASFVDAAAQAAEAETVLGAALEATGHAAGFQREQLVSLSEQLQDVTKYEAETTQGAMAIIATFKNVRGDEFIRATKLAQDMATVLKGDLSGAAMQVAKALNDPTVGITALTRSGVSFTDQQKEMIKTLAESGKMMEAQRIILDELSSEFGGAAEKVGSGFTGKLEQTRNRLGDMAEDIGAVLIESFGLIEPLLQGTINFLENLVPIIEETSKGFIVMAQDVNGLGGVLEWLLDAGITVFTGFEFVIDNFGKLIERMSTKGSYDLEYLGGNFKYWFSEVIPYYLTNLSVDWKATFEDMLDLSSRAVKGIGLNLAELGKQRINPLYKPQFVNTFEGFETRLREWPELAGRVIADSEKELLKKLGQIDKELESDFGQKFNENREAWLSMFQRQVDDAVDMTNKASKEYEKITEETKKTKEEKKKADKEAKADKESESESRVGDIEDLESLQRRIQQAAAKIGQIGIAGMREDGGAIDMFKNPLPKGGFFGDKAEVDPFHDDSGEKAQRRLEDYLLGKFGIRGLKMAKRLGEQLQETAAAEHGSESVIEYFVKLVDEMIQQKTLQAEMVTATKEVAVQSKRTSDNIDKVGRLY